ncbi:hypothetical protein [Microbacterium gorillae]|uniref:hypothetical protein n=1 Tax=Microbacterium gorillae TaxID=1231063 RepID=UPI003D96BBFD
MTLSVAPFVILPIMINAEAVAAGITMIALLVVAAVLIRLGVRTKDRSLLEINNCHTPRSRAPRLARSRQRLVHALHEALLWMLGSAQGSDAWATCRSRETRFSVLVADTVGLVHMAL